MLGTYILRYHSLLLKDSNSFSPHSFPSTVLWLLRHSFTISSHSFLRIDFAPRSFSPYDLVQNRKHSAHNFFRYPHKKPLQSKDHILERHVHPRRPTHLSIHIFSRTPSSVLSRMFSKLSVVCIAALAVVTQAGHGQHHTHSHKNGTLTQHPFHDYEHKPSASAGYPGEAGISSGVAPYPAGTGGYSSLSTGASPGLLTTGVPVPTSMTTGFPTLNQSGDTTLTYVIGSGSSTTTVVTTIHHTSYQTNYNVNTIHLNSVSSNATNIESSSLSIRPQVSLARAVRMGRVALQEVTKRSMKRYIPPCTSLLRLLLVAGLVALVRGASLVQPAPLLSLSPSLDLSRPSLW